MKNLASASHEIFYVTLSKNSGFSSQEIFYGDQFQTPVSASYEAFLEE